MKKIVLIILFAGTHAVSAQDQATLDQSIKDWERAKSYIQEYMESMPEDGFGFKPTPEMRSFAEQFLHIADANFGFASFVSGVPRPMERDAAEKSADKSKVATSKLVAESYDYVIKALKDMNVAKFKEVVRFNDMDMSRAVIMSKCFEHQAHHRGQTTVYLRLKGVKPPAEKLF